MSRPRFNPSPWARQALGDDDYAAIKARAEVLDAYITAVGGSPGGPWTVHVMSERGELAEHVYSAEGPLAFTIGSLLDKFRLQRDLVDEALEDLAFPQWTPEELVQIAAQSGIEVERR